MSKASSVVASVTLQ